MDDTVVDVAYLPRWDQIEPTEPSVAHYSTPRHRVSPFPFRADVNRSIAVWCGELSNLNTTAVVHSSNESLSESNPVTQNLLERAGPGIRSEIKIKVKTVPTGQARLTEGYNLPARYVIHTATPRYNAKYHTAAAGTLHSCYREVLQLVYDHQLNSVALPCLHSARRGFPSDLGAHIALRTVRRYLERFASSQTLVVLVPDPLDSGIYEVLMPFYFPRSCQEEEYAKFHLPEDIGDEFGGPVIPDRAIRIIDNPQHGHQIDNPLLRNQGLEDSGEQQLLVRLKIGDHSFSKMEDDVDKQRLLGSRPTCADPSATIISQELCKRERYERLLRRARTEDLSEISGIGCLYQTGKDKYGRPVICFIGKWFRFTDIDLDKALLYLIYLLEPLVASDYTIVYFHTLTDSENHPSMAWIRLVYDVLEYKYKKNLKAFYIVHPTVWTRLMSWWFTTFMAPGIKKKVHTLTGVEYLYEVMDMDQLEIPAFITEYDMSINGFRYYRPQT